MSHLKGKARGRICSLVKLVENVLKVNWALRKRYSNLNHMVYQDRYYARHRGKNVKKPSIKMAEHRWLVKRVKALRKAYAVKPERGTWVVRLDRNGHKKLGTILNTDLRRLIR